MYVKIYMFFMSINTKSVITIFRKNKVFIYIVKKVISIDYNTESAQAWLLLIPFSLWWFGGGGGLGLDIDLVWFFFCVCNLIFLQIISMS